MQFLLPLCVTLYLNYWSPLPYQEEWWSADDYQITDPLHKRHRIADWFVLTDQLDGLSTSEITALLGPPHDTDYFREWNMVYHLGQERGGFLAIDSEWLLLETNAEGYVVKAIIARD